MHDELVVAVPKDSHLSQDAERVAHLMRKGMQEVVPDVRIDVDWDVVDRWSKGASVELNDAGFLVADSPTKALTQVGTDAPKPVVSLGGAPVTLMSLSSTGSCG